MSTKKSILSLRVNEPWLLQIFLGRKRVEGRSGSADKFADWPGRIVRFFSNERTVRVIVIAVRHYDTLYDYLAGEGWQAVAPHLTSLEDTIAAYHEFYSDEDIARRGGMNGIEVRPISCV